MEKKKEKKTEKETPCCTTRSDGLERFFQNTTPRVLHRQLVFNTTRGVVRAMISLVAILRIISNKTDLIGSVRPLHERKFEKKTNKK